MAQLKDMLDTIDKVRICLSGVPDQGFYEELLSSVPQFVVCGAQSSGKSSVISRSSGVPLPEASTLCTRIPTLIQMRRESQNMMRVRLLGPGGDVILDETLDEPEQVRDRVFKAQEKALQKSGNTQFVNDHTVQIEVHGPDKYNVTLVDLPGFHTDNDEDTKIVNEMVKRYIEMPGTLALHVIKGDQDYASVLGNDFMRQVHHNARVTVLTHCDKLDLTVDSNVQHIQTTLQKTSENSSLTVAVLGSASDDQEEMTQLANLDGMGGLLEVGRGKLLKHLEDQMSKHLFIQYPKAIRKLKESLDTTRAQLVEVKQQSPLQALFQMAAKLKENWRNKRLTLLSKVREIVTKMAIDIKGFKIKPLTQDIELADRLRDQFEDPLEVGQIVGVMQDRTVSAAIVTSIQATPEATYVDWCRDAPHEAQGVRKGQTQTQALYSEEGYASSCIINDIKRLAADRGMRNEVHLDRQPIIACYTTDFAKHCTKKLQEARMDIHSELTSVFDSVFGEGIAEMSHFAATQLRSQMGEYSEKAQKKATDAIRAIESHNVEPDLVFTTHEHCLNSSIQKMLSADEADGTRKNNDGLDWCRHIYYNVRAFIKVQRQIVSELGSKELVRTLVLESETLFHHLLDNELTTYLDFVKEPEKIVHKRDNLMKRKAVLEEALQLMQ